MIEREPPRATAQPKLWQAEISAIPTAELSGRSSRAVGVRRDPAEQRLAPAGVFQRRVEQRRRHQRPQAEARQLERVARDVEDRPRRGPR